MLTEGKKGICRRSSSTFLAFRSKDCLEEILGEREQDHSFPNFSLGARTTKNELFLLSMPKDLRIARTLSAKLKSQTQTHTLLSFILTFSLSFSYYPHTNKQKQTNE
jgi:hypothetical protein